MPITWPESISTPASGDQDSAPRFWGFLTPGGTVVTAPQHKHVLGHPQLTRFFHEEGTLPEGVGDDSEIGTETVARRLVKTCRWIRWRDWKDALSADLGDRASADRLRDFLALWRLPAWVQVELEILEPMYKGTMEDFLEEGFAALTCRQSQETSPGTSDDRSPSSLVGSSST